MEKFPDKVFTQTTRSLRWSDDTKGFKRSDQYLGTLQGKNGLGLRSDLQHFVWSFYNFSWSVCKSIWQVERSVLQHRHPFRNDRLPTRHPQWHLHLPERMKPWVCLFTFWQLYIKWVFSVLSCSFSFFSWCKLIFDKQVFLAASSTSQRVHWRTHGQFLSLSSHCNAEFSLQCPVLLILWEKQSCPIIPLAFGEEQQLENLILPLA